MYKNKCKKCGLVVLLFTILAAALSLAAARGPLTEVVMQTSLYAGYVEKGISEKNEIIAVNNMIEKYRLAKQGNIVEMGSYPQGPNGEVRPIEWIVLEVEEKKALLISRYGLDVKKFHQNNGSVTWEHCTLRYWLNNEFYNKAFNAEEASVIAETHVKAEKNPEYNTYQGKDTRDKVFLLNIQEAYNYFKDDEARKCYPTEYAVKQGAYKTDEGSCLWWLRSSGDYDMYAAVVGDSGWVHEDGSNVSNFNRAVRPALWINL